MTAAVIVDADVVVDDNTATMTVKPGSATVDDAVIDRTYAVITYVTAYGTVENVIRASALPL
jgi:hypothetical protein